MKDAPKVERARQRVRRMIEDLAAIRDALDDFAAGVVGTSDVEGPPDEEVAERIAALVDRWWNAALCIRDPDREFRMRFIDAVELGATTGVDLSYVRLVLCVRTSPEELLRFTDEQMREAIAAAGRRGRKAGPGKWATLARILDGSEAHAKQLEDEHRLWSEAGRRERKRERRRGTRAQ